MQPQKMSSQIAADAPRKFFPMSTASNPAALRRHLLKIVLLGLLLRVAGIALIHSYRVKLDNDESALIAASLASGQGFSNPFGPPTGPTAWLGPVYPFVLSGFFRAFGPYTRAAIVAALLLNCLISAVTCLPIYFIGRYHFRERSSHWSDLGVASFPQ